MTDDVPFPLYSVWQREYAEDHWVVFCVCEVDDAVTGETGRRVARIIAKHDPKGRTSSDVFGTFRFDPYSWFASKCARVA